VQLLYSRSRPGVGPIDTAELLSLYRHRDEGESRGWLRSNFVVTLDGSTTGSNGRSGTINTESDREIFALQRALADVILAGGQTARAERYRAVDLSPQQRKMRSEEGLAPFPLLVIVSRSLNLDPAVARPAVGFGGPTLIVTTLHRSAAEVAPFEKAGVEVVRLGAPSVDLAAVRGMLAERGYRRILCEGGPTLHPELLTADLVDELCLTMSPLAVAGPGKRVAQGPLLDPPADFRLNFCLLGDDGALFLDYERVR
jgi:riboflavin biosynthesis pyrimidine reductase